MVTKTTQEDTTMHVDNPDPPQQDGPDAPMEDTQDHPETIRFMVLQIIPLGDPEFPHLRHLATVPVDPTGEPLYRLPRKVMEAYMDRIGGPEGKYLVVKIPQGWEDVDSYTTWDACQFNVTQTYEIVL